MPAPLGIKTRGDTSAPLVPHRSAYEAWQEPRFASLRSKDLSSEHFQSKLHAHRPVEPSPGLGLHGPAPGPSSLKATIPVRNPSAFAME